MQVFGRVGVIIVESLQKIIKMITKFLNRWICISLLMTGVCMIVTSCSSDDEKDKEPVSEVSYCFSGMVLGSDDVQGFALVQIESVPSTTDYNNINVGMGIVAVFPAGSSATYKYGDIIDFQILTCENYTSGVTDDRLPPSYICNIKLCE